MRREHAQARQVWPALRKEIFYNKYVNVLYRVVFCHGWRVSELEAASTRDHDQAWTDSVLEA